jgi:hypothetical protein
MSRKLSKITFHELDENKETIKDDDDLINEKRYSMSDFAHYKVHYYHL